MSRPRREVEGTRVEEEGTALGPHYHGEFGEADVVADAHPERETVGGLHDGDADGERGREGGRKS